MARACGTSNNFNDSDPVDLNLPIGEASPHQGDTISPKNNPGQTLPSVMAKESRPTAFQKCLSIWTGFGFKRDSRE
jgi:hypothetical protein